MGLGSHTARCVAPFTKYGRPVRGSADLSQPGARTIGLASAASLAAASAALSASAACCSAASACSSCEALCAALCSPAWLACARLGLGSGALVSGQG